MREIKFRAWNGKEMIEPYSVKNGKAMIIKQCDKNDPVLTDGEGVNYYCNWDVDVETDYPLMQYTGLKDCEGTEIYEGDVVRSDHFVDVEGVQHYVHHTCEWSDKYSGWYFRNNSESFDGDGGIQAFVMMKFLSERNIKVIGNIHQNPDLLPTDTSSR